jgi:biopolymer transport protein ExbB
MIQTMNLLPADPAPAATQATAAVGRGELGSLYEILVSGGPIMIPIGLCSVVALAYAVERWLRLSPSRLGTSGFERDLLGSIEHGGVERGLAYCREHPTALARVMQPALARFQAPFLEREKLVEDAGQREVRHMSANLRPLILIYMIAPLLGLLGTVWGIIIAFSEIALGDGQGRPELLANGISQALVTTAAGLVIAIPTQAVYFYFRGRIDRFARRAEELYGQVTSRLEARA